MKTWQRFGLAAALCAAGASASAALFDRGGGMIYDSTRDITWLADMNYALSSGYAAANVGGVGANQVQSDGRMGWEAARTWAGGLVYGSFDDWRLATILPSDTSCTGGFGVGRGYNCTGGELSGLFVTELGNKAGESVLNSTGDTATQIANLTLFTNVNAYFYWAETSYSPVDAWAFGTGGGTQGTGGKDVLLYALAVRDGDVGLQVPEPQTLALSLLALGAAAAARTRRSS